MGTRLASRLLHRCTRYTSDSKSGGLLEGGWKIISRVGDRPESDAALGAMKHPGLFWRTFLDTLIIAF